MKNQLCGVSVEPDLKKVDHTFTLSVEFIEPITQYDAARFLQRKLAEMCNKEFDVTDN